MHDELYSELLKLRGQLATAVRAAGPDEREQLIDLRNEVDQACRRIRLGAFHDSTEGVAEDHALLLSINGKLAAAQNQAEAAREAAAVVDELANLLRCLSAV
ncbi:hypothetical protein [Vulgatibacter incomptus]|uniref:Uncharacterized protein n=1 Tax=Vulgatibacter incomptus TaxID=1391653 RepID=A0A0K1PG11_9BACT|nr:hypothetical protein [Vulgatibacter incomptus]AKU92455.1 hypothetical protein AKJ08_2842 [Vulgatibacter incomptus]